MANTINCPVCGKLTDSRLDSCPHCGAYLKSRRQGGKSATAAKKAVKSCPRCGSGVQEGDLICVACGTNLLTGHKIAEETKSRKRRQIPWGWIAGISGAIVVVLGIGALWVLVATGDPLSQARRLAADGRTLEAAEILTAYIERVPDDVPALLELGRLQWKDNKRAEAAATFARASRLDPANADAALWAASTAASTATGATPDFVEILQRAAELNPNNGGVWYVLALARGMNGNYQGEIDALRRVLELHPTDDSARLSLGVAMGMNENTDQARIELQSVGDGPQKAEALAAIGFLAALRGDEEQSTRRLNEALAAGDLSVAGSANLLLGRALLRQGSYTEAQTYLEQALSAEPSNRQALYLRGLCLQARGRYSDAIADFDKLIADPGPYQAEAGVQAADAHLALNAPDRARRALDDASRAGARTAAYYTVSGRLSLASEDPDGALIAFENAIRTDPNYPAAYLERGLVHVQRDATAQGLADLDKYLQLVGEGGRGSRVGEVKALADQLRQAGQGSEPARTEANV